MKSQEETPLPFMNHLEQETYVQGKTFSRIQSISCDVFVVAIEVLCLILVALRIISEKLQSNRNNIFGAYENIDPSQKSYLNTEMMIFVKTFLLKAKQSLIRKSSSPV